MMLLLCQINQINKRKYRQYDKMPTDVIRLNLLKYTTFRILIMRKLLMIL